MGVTSRYETKFLLRYCSDVDGFCRAPVDLCLCAGNKKGHRCSSSRIRESGDGHGHVHEDWRRSSSRRRCNWPHAGQTRLSHPRVWRLLSNRRDFGRRSRSMRCDWRCQTVNYLITFIGRAIDLNRPGVSGEPPYLVTKTMDLITLTEIRRAAQNGAVSARVHVQVEAAAPKLTREQQPYCELVLADACDRMTLRVWSDHPAYKACSALATEDFIELSGEFHRHSQYGLEARKWTVRPLRNEEKNELLQGPAELRTKQAADWEFIVSTTRAIADPRLRALCDAFLREWGDRFRRTAAARNYHHARRGGLVEHTAQMMRI